MRQEGEEVLCELGDYVGYGRAGWGKPREMLERLNSGKWIALRGSVAAAGAYTNHAVVNGSEIVRQ